MLRCATVRRSQPDFLVGAAGASDAFSRVHSAVRPSRAQLPRPTSHQPPVLWLLLATALSLNSVFSASAPAALATAARLLSLATAARPLSLATTRAPQRAAAAAFAALLTTSPSKATTARRHRSCRFRCFRPGSSIRPCAARCAALFAAGRALATTAASLSETHKLLELSGAASRSPSPLKQKGTSAVNGRAAHAPPRCTASLSYSLRRPTRPRRRLLASPPIEVDAHHSCCTVQAGTTDGNLATRPKTPGQHGTTTSAVV